MIMVAVHEQVPTRHRSKAALLGINFINMRTLILAIVDVSAASKTVGFQRGMVAMTLLVVLPHARGLRKR